MRVRGTEPSSSNFHSPCGVLDMANILPVSGLVSAVLSSLPSILMTERVVSFGTLTMPRLVPSAAGARKVQTSSRSRVMAMVPLPVLLSRVRSMVPPGVSEWVTRRTLSPGWPRTGPKVMPAKAGETTAANRKTAAEGMASLMAIAFPAAQDGSIRKDWRTTSLSARRTQARRTHI